MENNVRELQGKLALAEKEYDAVAKDLQVCTEEYELLLSDFNRMNENKNKLQGLIDESKVKLLRAEQLTSLLSDEEKRWQQSVVDLEKEKRTLLGDVFISSAMVSYFGPLSAFFRSELLGGLLEVMEQFGVSYQSEFDFVRIMGDPIVTRDWNINGLPHDDNSLSSGLLIYNSQKWAVIIDPQQQAIKWLLQEYHKNERFVLLSFDMSEKKIIEQLKMAVQNGSIVIIEGMRDELPSYMDSIVDKEFYFSPQDQQYIINFNGESLLYDPRFMLVITNKNDNPQFKPEVFIRTNVINFGVTSRGLEEQLLSEVMLIENPQEEERKNENIEKISGFQKQMKEIEEKILYLLVQCENSPVDDENLVNALQMSKSTTLVIAEKIAQVQRIDQQLTKVREFYRSVAQLGSLMYFVVQDISKIDPMYQYSLQYVIKLFRQAIKGTTDIGEERVHSINENIKRTIYLNVQRGIFAQHKLLLSFMILANIKISQQELSLQKWNYFLTDCGVVD